MYNNNKIGFFFKVFKNALNEKKKKQQQKNGPCVLHGQIHHCNISKIVILRYVFNLNI